jgi:hypothetical protein
MIYTDEDDEFNRIERESKLRMEAVYQEVQKSNRAMEREYEGVLYRPWMVFNVGCIECGVSSAVVGFYRTQEEANQVAQACEDELHWREGGQNSFEVFNLVTPQAQEYKDVIAKLKERNT